MPASDPLESESLSPGLSLAPDGTLAAGAPLTPVLTTDVLAPGGLARLMRRIEVLSEVGARASVPLLRVSLGIVYIWFGALKLTDATPVAQLVAHTMPFLPEKFFVPALGAFEVVLGLGLIVGRYLGILALLMVAHLGGTFLVLVTQPEQAFQNGNPLMLSMVGEFVVKNVVLITAGILLATTGSRAREPRLANRAEREVETA